jgi:16S rRNA (cytosine967-C5)-methyltransferase
MNRSFAIAARALETLGPGGRGRAKAELDHVLAGLAGSSVPRVSELVYGVVRRRRTLHALLNHVARRALKGRSSELAAALELGAYALVYQEGAHAAHARTDAVELVTGKKNRARVERVLSDLAAVLEGEPAPESTAPPERAARGEVLPVRRGLARLLRESFVPESASPSRRLALLHSYPDELVQAWADARGIDVALELCRAGNDPPPLFIRANSRKTTPESLASLLAEEGLDARPRPELGPHVLELDSGRGSFRETRAFRSGLFTVQDATAQEAARLLAPSAGERILDLCAAPGTKTTYLAELALDQATIVATDVSPKRLSKIAQSARRLELGSIETRPLDARRPESLRGGRFEAVLVDAPCSNTGVLRRRPEARWRYSPRSQRAIVERQAQILATAIAALAPGGRLVYSVCSIEPEEGRALVEHALTGSGLARVQEIERLPSPEGGDGGYAALLR